MGDYLLFLRFWLGTFEPQRQKTNLQTCALSEDSEQHAYSCCGHLFSIAAHFSACFLSMCHGLMFGKASKDKGEFARVKMVYAPLPQ